MTMPRGGIIFDLQPHSARNLLALHCKGRRVSDSLLRFFEWRSRTHISTRKKEWRKWSSATHQTGRYSRQVELRPLIATVWLFFFFFLRFAGMLLIAVATVPKCFIAFGPFLSMRGSGVLIISCLRACLKNRAFGTVFFYF